MELDTDRIDAAVLALLLLGLHDGCQAWKTFGWDAMNRLHEKGFISDPSQDQVRRPNRGRPASGGASLADNVRRAPTTVLVRLRPHSLIRSTSSCVSWSFVRS